MLPLPNTNPPLAWNIAPTAPAPVNMGINSGIAAYGTPPTQPVQPLAPVAPVVPSPLNTGAATQNNPAGAIAGAVEGAADAVDPEKMGLMDRFLGGFLYDNGKINFESVGHLAKSIGAFGTLYQGIQQNKIARESLAMQKRAFETNLSSQLASYNLALEDRMRARGAQTGQSQAEIDAKIARHRLEA